MKEREIQNRIRIALAPHVLLFRANVGKFQMKDGRWFDTGLPPGFADLFGIHIGTGSFVAIECKSRTGKPSYKQERFLQAVRDAGGIAGVCRSPEEALTLIKLCSSAHINKTP
jgi:hypothetical protein